MSFLARAFFPFVANGKSADRDRAGAPATHEARTKRDDEIPLLFECPSTTRLLKQFRKGLKINLHTSSNFFDTTLAEVKARFFGGILQFR